MMELIKEYNTKISECEDRVTECLQERANIQDGECNSSSYLRDRYIILGNEIIELYIKLEVYREIKDKLVAYFTTNA